jgi:putative ATP-dependent endonuclease of OLD family
MRICNIRLRNFRRHVASTVDLDPYCCLVGPNGAGKSTILAALNLFFSNSHLLSTATRAPTLDDFHKGDVSAPIEITVTFTDLSPQAKTVLADYVRIDTLSVTAVVHMEKDAAKTTVAHFGERRGIEAFRKCFDLIDSGPAAEVKAEYNRLQSVVSGLEAYRNKEQARAALIEHERNHPADCSLIRSRDNFYGFAGDGKLAPFIQWVYIPAVKDAAEEATEGKNTALGKLLQRTVRGKTNLDTEIRDLLSTTQKAYGAIVERNQSDLDNLATRLNTRLESWAHPGVNLAVRWGGDAGRAVQITHPNGYIESWDGDFRGTLDSMGHGLQRSYLFAILHELAEVNTEDGPKLALGIEEPELYQHPPQARHLADTLKKLAEAGNQVIITTHSPLFVRGEDCECVRVVSRAGGSAANPIRRLDRDTLKSRLDDVLGKPSAQSPKGLVARISQDIQPHLAEMFFAERVVFVEGPEDVAYLLTYLNCLGLWGDFRRSGSHVIPVYGKSNLLRPLAIAENFEIPTFVVFDGDADVEDKWRGDHERDNAELLSFLGQSLLAPFPKTDVIGCNFAVFRTQLAECVSGELGEDAKRYRDDACRFEGRSERMPKNGLAISAWLTAAFDDGYRCQTLCDLCERLAAPW